MNTEKKKNILRALFIVMIITIPMGFFFFYFTQSYPIVIKSLPNQLLLNNGTIARNTEEWELRRAEIKELLLNEEYGTMPGRPDAINSSLLRSISLENNAYMHEILLQLIPHNETPSLTIEFNIWLYVPDGDGDGMETFPVVVKVAKDGTGSQEAVNQTLLDRGYMYVCYNHTALDPDTEGYDVEGQCQTAYPEYSWGSLAVWAWGAMRVADFLVQELWVTIGEDIPISMDIVDSEKLIVTGHSRRGKTALLAGALDERFAMVVPNGSGCGGAGSFLIQNMGSETIALITWDLLYKSWFHEDFGKYSYKEYSLPFDQHFLRSLVAPRFVLSTDGLQDYWANPAGTYAMYRATNLVYELYNATDNNAIHYRQGGHGFLKEDFEVLLNFADKMLLGMEIDAEVDNFYSSPFNFNVPILHN